MVSAFFPFEAFGLGGVSVLNDRILVAIGLNPRAFGSVADACRGQGSVCRDKIKAIKHQAGRLIEVDPEGGWTLVASVGAYNYDWIVEENPSPGNPDFQPGDADPYGLLAAPEGTYIADGGSNTIGIVDNAGAVSVLAYLPDPPNHEPLYDAVATCVAKVGGAVYVGTLTGSLFKWQNDVLTQVLSRRSVPRDRRLHLRRFREPVRRQPEPALPGLQPEAGHGVHREGRSGPHDLLRDRSRPRPQLPERDRLRPGWGPIRDYQQYLPGPPQTRIRGRYSEGVLPGGRAGNPYRTVTAASYRDSPDAPRLRASRSDRRVVWEPQGAGVR